MHPIRIFVSHSFSDFHHQGGVEEFRTRLESVFQSARASLDLELQSMFWIDTFFDLRSYGLEISPFILDEIRRSNIFIADITGGKENILYELGYAQAIGIEVLILRNTKFETELKKELKHALDALSDEEGVDLATLFIEYSATKPEIPVDLGKLLVANYSYFQDIESELKTRLSTILRKFAVEIRSGTFQHRPRCFWFDPSIKTIHIICSPEPKESRGQYADISSDNFIFLDNLEDRDAVLELSMFLTRSYPNVEICIHSSEETSINLDRENLVIVGGPLNNRQARQFIKRLGINIDYNLAREIEKVDMQFSDGQAISYDVKRDSNGLITNDVGYFGWFSNPLKKENRVVLCQGYQTWGTLASARLFSDESTARRNRSFLEGNMHKMHIEAFSAVESVEALLNVSVMEDRHADTPLLEQFNSRLHVVKKF